MFNAAIAQNIIDESPFGRWWGFKVEHVRQRHARLLLPVRAEFFRPGGVLQGGCAMTLADVTFWIAAATTGGVETAGLTLEQTSTFLGVARTDLSCEAEVLRAGRSVVYGTANVFDTSGDMVAHHTLTYLRPSQPKADT